MPSRREILAAIGGVGTVPATARGGARTPTPDSPTTAWTRSYHDSSIIEAIRPVDDGYVLAGSGISAEDDYRGYVAKTTATGRPRWQRLVGDSTSELGACAPHPDGGVVVVGATNIPEQSPVRERSPASDPWLVRLDASGDVVWSRTLQPSASDGRINAVTRVADGYLVGGYRRTSEDSNVRPWLAHVSVDGHRRWARTVESRAREGVVRDLGTTDDAWYVGGWKTTPESAAGESETAFVARLDFDGDVQWRYAHEGRKQSRIAALQADGSGVVGVGNRRFSADDDGEGWHLRITANGTVDWQHSHSTGRWNWLDGMAAVDDGYLLVGTRERSPEGTSDDGPRGAWVLDTGPTGRLNWETTYFDGESSGGYAIHPLGSNRFLVGGQTHTDDGDAGWLLNAGGTELETDSGASGAVSDLVERIPPDADAVALGAVLGGGAVTVGRRLLEEGRGDS